MLVKKKKDDQLARFKEAARKSEADTSDDALDNIMGKLDLAKRPDEKRSSKGK